MALQERPGSGSSALDIDTASAHRSLLSATEAALNFAASFHRDAQACRGPLERQRLHEAYRDKILAVDGVAANVAAALLPFLRGARGTEDGSGTRARWGDFDRLAQRGGKMRDRESQHLQHRSGIVAAWGLDCFEYYDWHALPLPLLRQLHDLAVLVPRWGDVVDLLNAQMLARHELRVVRGRNKALRVGEHSPASKVQAPHSPVERCDILAALEWARTKAVSAAVARRQVKRSARRFGLRLDVFGMVVPSTGGGSDDGEDKHEAADAEGDHLGDSTRPTKRTRLSSTGRGQSPFPATTASPGAQKNRASVIRNSGTPSTEPSELEEFGESDESEESESESEAQITRDESIGDESSAREEMRAEERVGGNETSQPVSPHLFATTKTGEDSLNDSRFENTTEKGLEFSSGLEQKERTESLFSWSGEDEKMGSESDKLARGTTTHHDPGGQTAQVERGSVEERIAGIPRGKGSTEREEAGDLRQEEQSMGTQDEYQMKVRSTGWDAKRPSLVSNVFLLEKDQSGRRSTPQSSTPHMTTQPVADRTITTPKQTTAAFMRTGQRSSLPVTSGGNSIERTPGAADEQFIDDSDSVPHSETSPAPSNSISPSRQPTLLETLQARHGDTVRRLVGDLSRPHASEAVSRQRRLQLSWLGPQRWARVHAEPEHRLGRSCVPSPEDADVWYLGWDAFRRHAEAGRPFPRPVVVKQEFQDSGTYDVVDYVDMLWQRFPEQQVEVQDGATGARSSVSLAEYCLAVANVDLGSADAAAAISSVTNLRRLARADEPLLSRLPRFRLLSTLADRVAGTVGRGSHLVANDAQSCLGFDLLSFAGAFSGSCVDPLVGSWARCLSGVQVVAVAAGLDAGDWQRFAREGRDWSPDGRGRLVVLEQDDVLLMPPGLRAVRATFAPEPCLMEGGMLWDECSIPEILDGLLWIVGNRAYTDDSIHFVFQLLPLVDALEKWLDDENYVGRPTSQAAAAERYQRVKTRIRSLRGLLRMPP